MAYQWPVTGVDDMSTRQQTFTPHKCDVLLPVETIFQIRRLIRALMVAPRQGCIHSTGEVPPKPMILLSDQAARDLCTNLTRCIERYERGERNNAANT